MRGIKILGYVLGGIVVVVALLLIGVAIFVNPNDYKDRIVREVRESTGRDLSLPGDIKLSVFPWIALELGPLSLGNPPGFGAEPFLSVQHAALRVRLLPLLQKSLEVGRVEVEGLDLRLKKNDAGKGNWEDFGQKPASPEASRPASSDEHSGVASLRRLGGIRIKDSRISYDTLTVSKVNLELGNVSDRTAVPLQASFDVTTGPTGSDLSFTANLEVTFESAHQRYGLQGVTLGGEWKQTPSSHGLPWKFNAPSLSVDLTAQTLKSPTFSAEAGAAKLSGVLAGEKIVDAPALHGSFKLEPLALRDFLGQFGVDLPRTRDPKALSKASASSDFSYGHKALRMENLDLALDDTQLRGMVAITNLETKATQFDLNVDHIDLDRYRGPEAAAPRPVGTKSDEQAVELPTTAVRALDAHGDFSVGSARVAGLSVSNLHLTLQANGGVVHLAPIKASLYGGTYSGDIRYDAHGEVPSVAIEQEVSGVDMTPLLKDGMKSERLSGRGNASARLAGSGRTSEALLRDLNGRIDASLADGAVNGIDLWYELNRAQALLKQTSLPAGSNDRKTRFDTFKMATDVASGVATTRELNIASQYLRVSGTGTANLITEAIDYHIVATILKAPPASQGADLSQLTLAGIPVEISGTMADPKVRPDLAGILKSQIKQRLQNTLQDKLQGIFGK